MIRASAPRSAKHSSSVLQLSGWVSQSVCVSWQVCDVKERGGRRNGAEESGRALGREGMERKRAVELWRERVRREKGEGEGAPRTYALAPQPLFDKYYRRGGTDFRQHLEKSRCRVPGVAPAARRSSTTSLHGTQITFRVTGINPPSTISRPRSPATNQELSANFDTCPIFFLARALVLGGCVLFQSKQGGQSESGGPNQLTWN